MQDVIRTMCTLRVSKAHISSKTVVDFRHSRARKHAFSFFVFFSVLNTHDSCDFWHDAFHLSEWFLYNSNG